MLDNFLGMFSADMAIDLGTANTLVYVKGRALFLMNHQWWQFLTMQAEVSF